MKNRPWIMLVLLVVAGLACRPRDITIGSDQNTSGNYWGRNVSKEFRRHQLQMLYDVMNSAETKKEIAALNCGRQLSDHEYSVTLWEEGKYRERIVRLQMTPRLYTDQECLQEAVNHVFERNVKAIDPGPPIDYGYRDPLTGKPLDTSEGFFAIPEKPNCPCTPSGSAATPDESRATILPATVSMCRLALMVYTRSDTLAKFAQTIDAAKKYAVSSTLERHQDVLTP